MHWQENATKQKSASKLFKKGWWQIRKNNQNGQIFTKTHPHAFRSKLNEKIAIKFEERAIRKTEIRKKQAQKTSKFQLKQAQKASNPQVLKRKPQFHKKSTKSREISRLAKLIMWLQQAVTGSGKDEKKILRLLGTVSADV